MDHRIEVPGFWSIALIRSYAHVIRDRAAENRKLLAEHPDTSPEVKILLEVGAATYDELAKEIEEED